MKFSELLETGKNNPQKSFVLGMIYARPILFNGVVLAYSAYRKGKRSNLKLEGNINDYYNSHKDKLKKFLGEKYKIVLNDSIENKKLDNNERIQSGVSVVIENDFFIPDGVDHKTYIYGLIEKWLIDSDEKNKKTFLVGAMDARGSLDFTGKYISLDIIEEDPMIVKRKISKYNDIIGTVFNYNPRLVQENSFQKNDQFRLPLFYYMGNFGLFTPFKIEYYISETKKNKENIKLGYFFLDKQFKDMKIPEKYISERSLRINNLAIKLQEKELCLEDKRRIVKEWKEDNFGTETSDEIIFSSQNIKELAKKNSHYLCENNNNHLTFNSKSNNKNYVEAHHLIPFSKRNKFKVSIDVLDNIICLCPNCHRKIHLAVDEERKEMLLSLFRKKEDCFKRNGIKIDLKEIFNFYKINL
jgi:hypothetical protein